MLSLTPLSGSCVTEPEHDSADCVPGERGCGQHLHDFSSLLISFEVVLKLYGCLPVVSYLIFLTSIYLTSIRHEQYTLRYPANMSQYINKKRTVAPLPQYLRLLGAMVPTGLAYIFLWFVPPSFSDTTSYLKFIYYIIFYFAFQLLLTVRSHA